MDGAYLTRIETNAEAGRCLLTLHDALSRLPRQPILSGESSHGSSTVTSG